MYTDFFGLNEKPFSITPDPRYLYLTRRHADALAHLIYGISESGGFIQLTGEVGTGKTTLIRSLLEQLPKKAKIAVILNPNLTAHEFLQAVCVELHILLPPKQSKSELITALNNYLLRAHSEGTRVVLIVDEAQTLDSEVLEQVRLLTNLETSKQKLLQIILIGQPELRDVLQRPNMRQIAQRVTGRYHLEPLRRDETVAYVNHRMKVAGAHAEVFRPSAIRELFRRSSGIPRLINVVADRALLAAYSMDKTKIEGPLVRRAAAEVFGKQKRRWWPYAALGLVLVAVMGISTKIGSGSAPRSQSAQIARAFSGPVQQLPDEPAPEPMPSVVDILDAASGAGEESAFAALFSLWGLAYAAGDGAPCSQADLHGLSCLSLADGSIGQLRRLDRPSVLTLTDGHGSSRRVLITGLGHDVAELKLSDRSYEVALADLAAHWHGEHTLLWRPHAPATPSLRPGMRGEAVVWLRNALARVRGESTAAAAWSSAPDYDAGLEQWVREYQGNRQLVVDGIAGAQTQIVLATELELRGVPLLTRRY